MLANRCWTISPWRSTRKIEKRELFQLSRYYTVPLLSFSSAMWRVRLRRLLKLMLVLTRLGHFLRLPNSFKDSPSNEISFRLAKWKSRMNACLCIPSYAPKSNAFCPHLILRFRPCHLSLTDMEAEAEREKALAEAQETKKKAEARYVWSFPF